MSTFDELDKRYYPQGRTFTQDEIKALVNSSATGVQLPAISTTNPGTPTSALIYPATPGVTYTYFKDNTGTAITIPTTSGGNPVISAFLVVKGTLSVPIITAFPIDISSKANISQIVQPTTLSSLRALTLTDNTLQYKIDFGSQIVRSYSVDPADTTTVDNGTTVIVTANGKRLKQFNQTIALKSSVISSNLFDVTKGIVGYIAYVTGLIDSTSTIGLASKTSDYIPLVAGQSIYISGRAVSAGTNGVAFYKSDFSLITPASQGANWGSGPLNGTYVAPALTAYFRFTYQYSGSTLTGQEKAEIGTVQTAYDAYRSVSNIDTINGVSIIPDYTAINSAITVVDAKSIVNQDNTNYGLFVPPATTDWYQDASTLVTLETDPFLVANGITRSVVFGAGVALPATGRFLFYKYNFGTVIDGKFLQIAYLVKTADITKISSMTGFFVYKLSTGTFTAVTQISMVIALVSPGIWEVRKTCQAPPTGSNDGVYIGANFAGTSTPNDAVTVAGFYCHYADTLAGATVTTLLPYIPKMINTSFLKGQSNPIFIKSRWFGKKVVWVGTSIPAGVSNGPTRPGVFTSQSYPNQMAARLGITMVNEALGGSLMRIATSTGATLASNFNDKTFARTKAEFTTAGFSGATLLNSYEQKLLTHLDADLYVFDFGYNDYSADSTAFATMPATAEDRNTFIGAHIFCINRLLEAKPRARIAIFGHYENQLLPLISQAQQVVADYFEIPIYETWKRSMLNNKTVAGTGGLSLRYVYMEDGLHPNSDVTGQAPLMLSYLAQSFLESIY